MDRRINGNAPHTIPAANYTEPSTKKKTRKWFLGGLFKRRRKKSSDTDSCSECEERKKGFLTLRSLNRRNRNGSHKVVGKFHAIILAKKNESTVQKPHINGMENYDASPNVIKRYIARERWPNGQEIEVTYQNPIDCIGGSNRSLDYTSRRAVEMGRVKKAKVKVTREHFESSSSDESASSSRTSNESLQRTDGREGGSRRSRIARTERYIKRHFKDSSPNRCCLKSNSRLEVPLNPRSKKLTPGCTMKALSATSSPLSSPANRPKNFQCSSLPGKYSATSLDPSCCRWDASSQITPPPPPRNSYRKVASVDLYSRPFSYALDANIKRGDVIFYISPNKSLRHGGFQQKSNSDVDLLRQRQFYGSSPFTYCTDQSPRSRNPIQLVDEGTVAGRRKPMHSRGSMVKRCYNSNLSLSNVNEIGVPVQAILQTSALTKSERPLSVVSEKSDCELQRPEFQKMVKDPKNLEEAFLELEEIYNSLRLSDEDLPDRADRRDLQSAIRMNPQFALSWNDSEGSEEEFQRTADERRMFSPRLRCRRSAAPNTVTDDMAFRKLNRRKRDVKSDSNLVLQSGSFLLMSPALSPAPLVDVAPVIWPLAAEPDITFDDVVYRNITQTNNKLRVCDPQPPFGIPLGPVSPASNSDYLHAVPGEKYRSRFNPSRVPDIVKDDLAFRNLRKDVRYRDMEKQVELVTEEAKKRRAIRSLSANVVTLMSDLKSSDEDTKLNVNCNHLCNRSVSFINLPDILDGFRCKKQILMENCRECLDQDEDCQSGAGKEYRLLGKWPCDSDTFRGRVSVHKPITLNQFKIAVERDQMPRTRTISHNSSHTLSSCQNDALYQDELADSDEITKPKSFENSSSGVSSTSDVLNSSRKGESNFVSNVCSSSLLSSHRVKQPMRYVTELFVDKGVTPSSSDERVGRVGDWHQKQHSRENADSSRKCSRIEITLSTPQPSGDR